MDSEGATQIFIHTQDRPSLFALTVSALDQLDLNIVDARIYTSGSGHTLDTFYVLDTNNQSIGQDQPRLESIKSLLKERINTPRDYFSNISRRTPRQMRLFSMPTTTTFSNDKTLGLSILEVITPDRPGLLARIAKVFIEFNVLIQNAKITTLGERVEDVFFITNNQQQAIEDEQLKKQIQQAICKELDEQATS